jgi:hypothetical protein
MMETRNRTQGPGGGGLRRLAAIGLLLPLALAGCGGGDAEPGAAAPTSGAPGEAAAGASPALAVVRIEAAFEDGRAADALAGARALQAMLADAPPDDPARIAAVRILVRALLQSEGGVGEAGLLAQNHHAALAETLGEDHTETLLAATVLARVIEIAGDPEEAERRFRDVLERAVASKGEPHTVVGIAAAQLQRLYAASGRTEAAAEMEALLARRPAALERGPINLDFESDDPGAFPEGWAGEPPGHRSRGTLVVVDDERCHGGSRCALMSGFAGLDRVAAPGRRNLLQTFDARPYRGREIRLAAAVRAQEAPGQDAPQLWLRADREDGSVALMENAGDGSGGPVDSGEWRLYELRAQVPADARAMRIGVQASGAGRTWLDDVSFEIVDPDG